MLRVVVLSLAVWVSVAGPVRAEEPFEDLAFDKALEKAQAEKKVVMIDFYTTWCGPCKMLDRNTWPDEAVKKLLKEKAVALKVDAERNRELSQKYRINSYPQIVFLKPDGTEIDRLVGYRDAQSFLRDAAGPLAGKDSVAAMRDAIAANPNDVLARVRFADALSKKGRPAEAVAEILWCFDVGMKGNPEYTPMRSTLLVSKLAMLARMVPEVPKLLQDRREAAAGVLMSPVKNEKTPDARSEGVDEQFALREAAMALAGIDRVTGAGEETIKLFDAIVSKGEELAASRRALAEQLVDVLWTAKRYNDIVSDSEEATSFLQDQIRTFETNKVKYNLDARYQDAMKQQTALRAGKYYEALLGIREEAAAKAFADRLLAFDGGGRVYATLITHAKRVGRGDLAAAWAEQGMKVLSEVDKAAVQRALNTIPVQTPAVPAEAAKPEAKAKSS